MILDLYSRAVVGWPMGHRLTQALVVDALTMALMRRHIATGLLLHSDQGCQYAAVEYHAILAEHGITCSMSRKGNCWDNACVESFFGTLKAELVHHQDYKTRAQALVSPFRYIEVFYNRINPPWVMSTPANQWGSEWLYLTKIVRYSHYTLSELNSQEYLS